MVSTWQLSSLTPGTCLQVQVESLARAQLPFSGLKEHAKEQCPFPRARAPESSFTLSKLGGQSQGSDSSRATRTSAPSASESPTSPSVQTPSIHHLPRGKEVKGSEPPQQCPSLQHPPARAIPPPPRAHSILCGSTRQGQPQPPPAPSPASPRPLSPEQN